MTSTSFTREANRVYEFLFRHLFTRVDEERAHTTVLRLLKVLGKLPPTRLLLTNLVAPKPKGMAIKALSLEFNHPLGLAAGFDKDACCLNGLGCLGFSFIEVGSITPIPQDGTPRKRLFRLVEDEALINRLGFPSAGVREVESNLRLQHNYEGPIGISLGKNKITPLIDTIKDYYAVLAPLYPLGDFFVVNISSPNTSELRKLQTVEFLKDLLVGIKHCADELSGDQDPKPLLIKIAPDLEWSELDDLIDLCLEYQIEGVIATNTTTTREHLHSVHKNEVGGLSGRPLRERSTEIVKHIYQRTQGQLCIVGVGGVFSGDDVWEKMAAGATLIQAYTGLIYEGPMFVKKVLNQLQRRMDEEGVQELREIIGVDSAV